MGTIILFALAIGIGVAVAVAQETNGSKGGSSHKDSTSNSFFGGSNSHKCNGDCDNCPDHYGYRYGRWYYGHGHQHGCERGGNGGASGRTYRD